MPPSAISTHVPHAGHDSTIDLRSTARKHFNSRAPCGARPTRLYTRIHHLHFNSRAPCGARHEGFERELGIEEFQLTCPMRGTTGRVEIQNLEAGISTHVPHAGHDQMPAYLREVFIDFNSRAPCGARRRLDRREHVNRPFQLTCPMRGTTELAAKRKKNPVISTHVPHAGHDLL